ncbi:MAG: OmpA family protein [Ignavibacteriae bacterium]|nr:OmpA family protein [Ignavibacteriota bacterium]MCB9250741.1 OmpA family protein [Ignavibacteriales bacterium]
MIRNQIHKIFLVFIFINTIHYSQIINFEKDSHPLSNNLLLFFEAGPNYGYTDYERSNIGISLSGGLEYYLPSQSKSIFGFKLNLAQQYFSGDKNFLGLPNTYDTDSKSLGIGLIYSYSLSDVVCPFISIGGSYNWYAFESKNIKSEFFDYSNGGEENSIGYDIDAGVKFNVAEGIGLMASFGYHQVANDNIDAIKIGDYQDFFVTAKLGLIVNLYSEPVDTDGDGIIDEKDGCPDVAEDFDGYLDDDGCPDNDNDLDGVLDKDDLCPNLKEDIDGFEDEDGCPDEDNDNDRIKDVDDECPNLKEDYDGFEDNDGCPEVDNDQDGIIDSLDGCPNVAETFNGYMDDDGCPDELPKVIIKEAPPKETPKKRTEEIKPKDNASDAPTQFQLLGESTFVSNSAQIKSSAYSRLNEIAETLKKYPTTRWKIEAHIDKQNSALEAATITKQQADAVLNYFISRGLSGANFQTIGAGDSSPVSSNSSVYGRMKNRRIIIRKLF